MTFVVLSGIWGLPSVSVELYAQRMSEIQKGEYRVSRNGLIVGGSVTIAVGAVLSTFTGIIGGIVAIAGVYLLVTGLVRKG